jgi:hypothetical protein
MNPPFSNSIPFIKHYIEQKAKCGAMSCVVMLPQGSKGARLVHDWQKLVTFPVGSFLFQSPSKKDPSKFVNMKGCPFAVDVWYDPPTASHLCPVGDCVESIPSFVFGGTLGTCSSSGWYHYQEDLVGHWSFHLLCGQEVAGEALATQA